MTPDGFITTGFCVTDDFLASYRDGRPLRERGLRPPFRTAVVVTCELVGEFLDYDTDCRIPTAGPTATSGFLKKGGFGSPPPKLRWKGRTVIHQQEAPVKLKPGTAVVMVQLVRQATVQERLFLCRA